MTYARRQAETLYDIFQKAADGSGGEEALVVRDRSQRPRAWSPDGLTLMFIEEDLDVDLWLLSLDGQPARQWLRTSARETEALYSPNGRWVAYSSNETSRVEVYVRSLAGDVTRQITTEGGSAPLWSRNGRELFYHSGDGMYVVEISTNGTVEHGRPRLLFEGPYRWSFNGIASYDVTGDAQRFLMIELGQSEAWETQLHFILNWGDELQELVPVP